MHGMAVALRVDGEPDFMPDYLDLPAPPPVGTDLVLDGNRHLRVSHLILMVQSKPHGLYSTHYIAVLQTPEETPR